MDNSELFETLSIDEEAAISGGLKWWQKAAIGQVLTTVIPVVGYAYRGYNAFNTLYEYNKRTAPWRDSNGRLQAS